MGLSTESHFLCCPKIWQVSFVLIKESSKCTVLIVDEIYVVQWVSSYLQYNIHVGWVNALRATLN